MAGNPIMRFFTPNPNLPAGKPSDIAKTIGDLATALDIELEDSPEKSAGMRKLLEAKDCFVRAAL